MAKGQYSGLVVRPGHVSWCAVQRNKGQVVVLQQDRVRYDDAAAEGADIGDVSDAAPLTTVLQGLRKRLKGPLSLALPVDQALLKVMTLPRVEPDELAGMVELQIDKIAPFPIDSVVMSHEVLATGEDTCVVLMAAVRKVVVEALGQRLVDGGITPRRVDIDVLGWWRVLRDAGELSASGSEIVVVLDADAPTLFVLQDGVPRAFRSLGDLCGLADAEQAAELGRELALSMMAAELDGLAFEQPAVSVWAAGGAPAALAAAAGDATGGEARSGDLDAVASASEGVARRGLDGAGMDLTPGTWSSARASAGFRKRVMAIAGGVLVTWLLAVGGLFGLIQYETVRMASLQQQKDALQPDAMAVRDLRRRVVMIRDYMDNSQSALECLRELSALLPRGVELTAYTFREGEAVKISGEADAVGLVYDFKTKIDESPLFPEATLQGPRTSRNRKELFDMELTLPGGAS